jgi:uncharacterized protein YbjT (DUF2867 family)
MILVVGATGELGGRIVWRLIEAGEGVMALVRPATDATALIGAGVGVVRGDLCDAESLPSALEGMDTLVTTANANVAAVDGAGNQQLIRAAQQAGVGRFVFVSAAGMGAEMARTGPLMAGKWQAERTLRSSSMRHVLVRPDMFQESWLIPPMIDARAGTALVVGRGQTPQRYVAVDDVAALCAHLAVAPDPPEVVEFGGPDELTRMEVIAAFEAATGKRFKVRHLPRTVLRAGHRILVRVRPDAALGLGLSLFFDRHAATWDDKPLRDAGIVPRPVSEFITASVADQT